MNGKRDLSAAARNGLAYELSVSVVVTLDDTTQGETHVFAVDGAELAGFLGTWFRSGGWRSIRVEPRSADGPPAVCVVRSGER